MSTLCNTIKAVCGIIKGSIMVMSPNGSKRFFYPSADTDVARLAIFKSAILTVPERGTMTLHGGSYILDDSLFNLSPHQKFKIYFEQGAWLNYTDPLLAEGSDFAYVDYTRFGKDFGITPAWEVDRGGMIQAALFSMPESGTPVIASDGNPDYPAIKERIGTLILQPGGYPIAKPIYMTGYQQMLCTSGNGASIYAMQFGAFKDDASALPEVFMLKFVRAVPGSNFSFNFRLYGIAFVNTWATNTKVSAALLGGAQGSDIDMVSTSGMWVRGIVFWNDTTYFRIGSLTLDSKGEFEQTGPHLHIAYCSNFTIKHLSLQFLNTHTGAPGDERIQYPAGSGLTLPCLLVESCSDFSIDLISAEDTAVMARFHICYCFTIGPMSNCLNNGNGEGEVMAYISDSAAFSFASFSAQYYAKFYQIFVSGVLHSEANALNTPTANRIGGITNSFTTITYP